MTLQNAQELVDNWIKTVGVRYFSVLTNTALLMEEVGEVARLLARIYGDQSFKKPEEEISAKEDLADEMADVLFVLICLANQTGVDLKSALIANIEKKTGRDSQRHSGNLKLRS
jgi:NTP pyrophosphatase (non-canonical NTP hydrolase)